MRTFWVAVAVAATAAVSAPAAVASVTDPDSTIDGATSDRGNRQITYVGRITDSPDLSHTRLGSDGWWFANFDAPTPVFGARTDANVRDALPSWVAAFNHTEHPGDPGCAEPEALARGCTLTYNFRTFSQDGPARSAGGHQEWANLRLPSGECGIAGAIVDAHTFSASSDYPDPTGVVSPSQGEPEPTTNNTINRIQLQDGVPDTFFVGVVTDTTAGQHDATRLEIRGNVGLIDQREEVAASQVESVTAPTPGDLAGNGQPDVHVFRIDHFRSGDYLKLRLRGGSSPAAIAGLVFDENLATQPGRRAIARCPR